MTLVQSPGHKNKTTGLHVLVTLPPRVPTTGYKRIHISMGNYILSDRKTAETSDRQQAMVKDTDVPTVQSLLCIQFKYA